MAEGGGKLNANRRAFVVQSLALLATQNLVRPAISDSYEGGAPSITAGPQNTMRVRVVGLKVDYLMRPLGLENRRPRLSWHLNSRERNVRQSAYRILVASSEEALEAGRYDLWDSGKVESGEMFGVVYQGSPLVSRQRCWWTVQVWDEGGMASERSQPSWWEMGLLTSEDWSAQWLAVEDAIRKADRESGLQWIWGEPAQGIGTQRFRITFNLPEAAQGGEIFAVVNDWLWTAHVGGIWLDGRVLRGDPTRRSSHNWTEVPSDSLTAQSLVLEPLNAGEHVLAVEVSNDRMVPPSVIRGFAILVRVNLANGETLRFGTGPNWKTAGGRVDGWFEPEYDDTQWKAARLVFLGGFHPMAPAPAMCLRRVFRLDKAVVGARLYVTALGAYEGRLNGRRVGDALLTPELSQYAERVLYQVYDVCSMLQPGDNVLAFTVGDGWYASWEGRYSFGPPPRRVLAQLELIFADGSRERVGTGPEWKIGASPILESQIRVGEVYDARLEQIGWDTPQFDDSYWKAAQAASAPSCRLVAQTSPPIRATQILCPRSIAQPKPGVYVFDFGQCFAGWCRLHAQGKRGTRIELTFAELLTSSGEVSSTVSLDMGEPKRDVFILGHDDRLETFEPHFTYRGFRYVQVTGLTAVPNMKSLEGVVVHSDLPETGRLRIDNPLIEQIWKSTVWAQRSNFVGIPTDCPSREQRGWLGDAGVFWDAATFNMDVCSLTYRCLDNFVDDQFASGMFPSAAPEPRLSDSCFVTIGGGPAWSDAGIILSWTVWRRYGDLAPIERHWDSMNRYLRFIEERNPDHLWRHERGIDVGDHLALEVEGQAHSLALPLPTTPHELVGTAYWAYSVDLMAQMAEATGRSDDAARLRGLFGRLRHAFNAAFVKPDGTVGEGSQTSYILALHFGLLPDRLRPAAVARLAADVRRRGMVLTTGYLGTQFSLDVLAEAGMADIVDSLLIRTEYPSWGYMLQHGATTLWESWTGEEEGISGVEAASQNHFGLGSICGYLFRRVAGIDAGTPGFKTIVVRPTFSARVTRGGGDYDSVVGRISTDWMSAPDGRFVLEVTVPVNATAHICLPARRSSRIEEGGVQVARRDDMRMLSRQASEAVIEVGSGSYRFEVVP